MAMSRRFYNNLATEYKTRKPESKDYDLSCEYDSAMGMWAQMVLATTAAIKEEAPSFDRERFTTAAGLGLVNAGS